MNIQNKFVKAIKDPFWILTVILRKLSPFIKNDALYLKLLYFFEMRGKILHLKNPKSFNEKLQWLKIYDYKPEYTKLVDKLAVKDYVESRIGNKLIIPTFAVWDSVEEIDWDSLPNQFVLKTTHDGGGCGVIVCTDKTKFDRIKAKKKLKQSMHTNTGQMYREKPYLNVPRKILAEKYIAKHVINNSETEAGLQDYKFFCFNGKVKFFKIDFGRFIEHHANYYSPNGDLLPFGEAACKPDPNHVENMPNNLSEMISLAEMLSTNYKFLRVDLYNVNGKIYFGEFTFYPAAGMGAFIPEEWDWKLGNMLVLS